MLTILHVADDPSLVSLVEDAFAAFGFTGTYLSAMTVAEGKRILADLTQYPHVDLILSDMSLPDGSGLDVVRAVRTNIARECVPIVILSGDTNPETVNRAYAVGVNSFISKGTRARSIAQTMTALYGHWLRDARLPTADRVGRTEQVVARAVMIRKRKAEVYMRIAERIGPEDGEFWMDLALREGNLANLLAFLRGQLGSRELPDHVLDDAERMQQDDLDALDEVATHPVHSSADAEEVIGTTTGHLIADVVSQFTASLFPRVPVAVITFRDVAASMLDDIAGWLESHAHAGALHARAADLRADAAHIRQEAATSVAYPSGDGGGARAGAGAQPRRRRSRAASHRRAATADGAGSRARGSGRAR